MSFDHIEAAKAAAQRVQGPHPIEFGYIATYTPADNTVTVYLPHDLAAGNKVARGPYPLFTPWVGNGWGLQVGPVGGGLDGNGTPQGEPCTLIYPDPEGEMAHVILGRFNKTFKAPGTPAGELWAVHKDGCAIKLKNGGTAQVIGLTELGAAGVSGTSGNAVVRQSDLQAVVNTYNGHTHAAPMGTTANPTQQATATASATVFAK